LPVAAVKTHQRKLGRIPRLVAADPKIGTQLISVRKLTTCLALCGGMAQAQVAGSTLHVEFVNATAYFSYCAIADIGKNSNKLTV